MAAASTSDRRFPRPTVAWALALLVSLLVGASVRADDNVYVQQEGTPIVSKPGVGGKILGWVGTGFPLTVHGREGDWLEVSSSLLTFPSESLWVPAARVGDRLPGAFDIAYAPDGQSVGPGGAFFQLEIGGTPDTRVRANCRAERGRDDAFRRIIDDVPAALDVDGDAVDCVVRKLESDGWVDVVLRGPDGTNDAGAAAPCACAATAPGAPPPALPCRPGSSSSRIHRRSICRPAGLFRRSAIRCHPSEVRSRPSAIRCRRWPRQPRHHSRSHALFIRFSTRSVTTPGSARVEVSPRLP
jgi:hypothetical protein